MRLDETHAQSALAASPFGVLGTSDVDGGVHLVPVVFVLDGDRLIIPVDTVKPKSTTRLRRIRNLESDPRASLLVDHRSNDWSELWWVRADMAHTETRRPARDELAMLAAKYPVYDEGGIEVVLVFDVTSVTGWSAESPPGERSSAEPA